MVANFKIHGRRAVSTYNTHYTFHFVLVHLLSPFHPSQTALFFPSRRSGRGLHLVLGPVLQTTAARFGSTQTASQLDVHVLLITHRRDIVDDLCHPMVTRHIDRSLNSVHKPI